MISTKLNIYIKLYYHVVPEMKLGKLTFRLIINESANPRRRALAIRMRYAGYYYTHNANAYIMGWATQRSPRPRLVATSQRLASCVIVSRSRTALDLDTYPLSNFIRPRCAERAKRGRGKPVLIMHIGFLACFHAISLERSRFGKIASSFFVPLWH